MSDWAQWFQQQLQSSAEGFDWAITQVPARLHDQQPVEPGSLGTWPPLRHIWHMVEYERALALPTMQQWAGAALPPEDAFPDDDTAWAAAQKNLPELREAFWQVRRQQLALLPALAGLDWEAPRETLWGPRSLLWVVTKTLQHTYEHANDLLRMCLWWEFILQEIARAEAQQHGAGES